MSDFDVIVVGGGHAGCEAAAAAARMGARTLLVTQARSNIGQMSCNPAIGGLAKGQMVREIDALDGLMGRAIDIAGIHFRILNRSKGPAVWGPRAQADRKRYAAAMLSLLDEQPNLTVREDVVEDVAWDSSDRIGGIITRAKETISAGAVVITTGTFLNGIMHVGADRIRGGRAGDGRTVGLSFALRDRGIRVGRLKTGTPPRLDGRTIDWDALEAQEGDETPTPFSFINDTIAGNQVRCHITGTTTATHAIIREDLHRAPLYSGQIKGTGPRYCPSIEDKVTRFPERDRHQIFLEPEGVDTPIVYPNGISTSLPVDLQERMVASIPGLEKTRIVRPGYAIEYDFVDARELSPTLECMAFEGLFLAGQINGTTGYEEAGGQGVIAGINAALRAGGGGEFILDRAQAYIGVMIDDLVTLGTDEPYRMFTSRAEYRLRLRSDNADQRLTRAGINVGVVGRDRAQVYETKEASMQKAKGIVESLKGSRLDFGSVGIDVPGNGGMVKAREVLGRDGVTYEKLTAMWPRLREISSDVLEQLGIDERYRGYVERQDEDIRLLRREASIDIPRNLDYAKIGGLSVEVRGKLDGARPATLAAAGRIPGITQAALTALLRHLKSGERKREVASSENVSRETRPFS